MIDQYLEVAYEKTSRQQATFELVGLLEGLSDWEVEKIASGVPLSELYGYLDHRAPGASGVKVASELKCSGDGGEFTFLERFKGSPLFEQAIALEQEELQAEMLDQQKRQERRATMQGDDQLWAARDRIRLRKRLLELELAKQENGGAAAAPVGPGAEAQGSGAPGPVPAEGVQDSSGGLGGGVAKMGAKRPDKLDADIQLTDADKKRVREGKTPLWGSGGSIVGSVAGGVGGGVAARRATKSMVIDTAAKAALRGGAPGFGAAAGILAGAAGGHALHRAIASHKDKKKHAEAEEKVAFADKIGRQLARSEFAKTAGGLSAAIGQSLNGGALGQAALKAMKHPAAAGALVGAAGGALAGGPDNRLGGALGGAALGAGAGHAAGGIGKRMAGGASLGDAAKAYGGGVLAKAKALGGEGAGPKA